MPGTHPQLTAPRQAQGPAHRRRVHQLRRDLQRAVPAPLAPRRHLPLRARGGLHPGPGLLRRRPQGHLHQRGVLPARAGRPVPEDRPGGGHRAAHDRGGRRSRGQRHLPAAAGRTRPRRGDRLPGGDLGPAQGGDVRLARLPQHGLLDRHGLLPHLPRPAQRPRPRQLHLRRPGARAPSAGGAAHGAPPVLRRLEGGRDGRDPEPGLLQHVRGHDRPALARTTTATA